eukprot:Gregarina_sp_Poly_1__1583@NODE_13_length_23366_cov_172_320786_g11_i0_p6_GENE_NODE_13_length_23366_cov_172_320786_g11_i0NODE_13_length_23366_cov_172_320786_g11_i0_p6_ORF_typecomplete_len254_score24_73VSNARE_C/PF12352_8/1_3e03VSNARE_C/PF12352_8/0_00069Sec20/PF03908_13/45Sec20/PF03908_13/1_5e04Sec20/PF03908_13/0_0088Spectrin/PF00435_21/2_4Spectrin/PF00435_21/7AAA_13/PF13166_6/0_15DUF3829/PF12889_7/15DUF3829/PF12889_7/5_7Phage_TAC_3/PF06896_11/4_5e03Phage_TAC_3/PF06896_11/0_33Laminin_II/PF06009_12/1
MSLAQVQPSPADDLKSSQLALRSQIRSHHADIEVNIAALQQVRSELSLASNVGNFTLSAEKVEELENRANNASRSIKNSLQLLRQCDQELLCLANEPQQFGQVRRYQDITSSLVTRHTNISTALDNMLHARRVELLLQKHKDHRDGDDEGQPANNSQQAYLMKEKTALNTTIDVIAESIASAKASYSNISTQGNRLRGAGRTAGQIVGQIKELNTLMSRIRHLQLKQQVILLGVFVFCLTLTLICVHTRILGS